MAENTQSQFLKINESTELMKMPDGKQRFINTGHKKVNARMYDGKCDVKLEVEKEVFRAHRDVLSDASDYFSAMFSVDMQEKSKGAIQLFGISPAGFSAMLEYFYRGHVTIEADKIEDLLEAARFFQVEWLVDVCCYYLVRHTSIENYSGVLDLADRYALGDLKSEIFTFIGQNFASLAQEESFLNLECELLTDLISKDYFLAATEWTVFDVVTNWLNHDVKERMPHMESLLSHVRFPLMHPEELDNLPPEMFEHEGIKALIEEAKEYHVNPFRQCLMNSERTSARGARKALTLISAIDDGEFIQYKFPGIEGFHVEEFDTMGLELMLEYANIVTLGNFMFAIGGYSRLYFSATTAYRFDPASSSGVPFVPCKTQDKILHCVAMTNLCMQLEG